MIELLEYTRIVNFHKTFVGTIEPMIECKIWKIGMLKLKINIKKNNVKKLPLIASFQHFEFSSEHRRISIVSWDLFEDVRRVEISVDVNESSPSISI